MLCLAGMPVFAYEPMQNDPEQALEIPMTQVISAKKRGRLAIYVDIFPQAEQIEAMPAGDRDRCLAAHAAVIASKLFAQEKYRTLDEATLEYIYITNLDEYQQADFSALVKHGGYTLSRLPGNEVSIATTSLSFQPQHSDPERADK